MLFRRSFLLAAAAVVLGVGVVGGALYWRSYSPVSADRLASHLPGGSSILISLDVGALRDSGILEQIAGSSSAEEADYRAFVDATGFEYRSDLDRILVAVQGPTTFILLTGRFDWKPMTKYVQQTGGVCRYGFCRLASSDLGRHISFFPLRPRVLAMAIGPDEWAAATMQLRKGPPAGYVSDRQPFWIFAPIEQIQDSALVPSGLRQYLMRMRDAESLTMSLEMNEGRLEMKLGVDCKGPSQATAMAAELNRFLSQIGELAKKEDPQATTLTAQLSTMRFGVEGARIRGRCLLSPYVFDSLSDESSPGGASN